MKVTLMVIRILTSLCGFILLGLGILFWTGNALELIPVHIITGMVLVLILWALSYMAARVGTPARFLIVPLAWSLIMPAFGLIQMQLLVNSAHWIIQVLHLLVGLVAFGLAGMLTARVNKALARESAGQSRQTAEPSQ
jgi:hypothetical protein